MKKLKRKHKSIWEKKFLNVFGWVYFLSQTDLDDAPGCAVSVAVDVLWVFVNKLLLLMNNYQSQHLLHSPGDGRSMPNGIVSIGCKTMSFQSTSWWGKRMFLQTQFQQNWACCSFKGELRWMLRWICVPVLI